MSSDRPTESPLNELAIERIKWSEKWMILLTGVVALASISASIIYWRQMAIMTKQLEEMRGSSLQVDSTIAIFKEMAVSSQAAASIAKSQARARLSIDANNTRNLRNPDKMEVPITVTNAGPTSAFKINTWGSVVILPSPLSRSDVETYLDVDSFRNKSNTNFLLQPGKNADFVWSPASPLSADWSKLKSEQFKLFVLGFVIYEDIFGEQHYTQICTGYSGAAIRATVADMNVSLRGSYCDGLNTGN